MDQMELPNATKSEMQAIDPMSLLYRAVSANVDPTSLERLMDLQERWERNIAISAFGESLARFQKRMPMIEKTRQADRYKFASFDDIMNIAQPILSDEGISVGFNSEQTDSGLVVTCRIRVGSYFEDRTFSCPIPSTMNVSAPQQYGAALSYAKRYCLCAALNIVVCDEDQEQYLDGELITAEQKKELADLLKSTNADQSRFFAFMGKDELAEFSQRDYERARRLLVQKKRKPSA